MLRKRVVITGRGVFSSLGASMEEFERRLLARECAIRPSERFLQQFENANASEVPETLDVEELPSDVRALMDKSALWGYKVGRDALSDARLANNASALSSTFLAVGLSSAATECFLPLMENRIEAFSLRKVRACGKYGSVCGSIARLLGLQGGFELVATACTASTNAIGLGYDQIETGQTNTALIIGTEPLYMPTFAGFYALKAMHEVACSPFSGTPGMSIGEGAGAILLEEYEHAKARGAPIYGEILSYATSSDAYHETAPDPRAGAAALAMKSALKEANLKPEDIDYINAHGTGTEANDRAETLAMKKVFPNIQDIPISSTKSYFGHNIGAAGIVEFLACLSTLPKGAVLPTLNFTVARSGCDLDYVPNTFQHRDVRVFMKNNYAFGGNNCSLIASVAAGIIPQADYCLRRVAITGVGAVTSLGCGFSEIVERIWNGEDGSSVWTIERNTSDDEERSALDTWLETDEEVQAVRREHELEDEESFSLRHHAIRNLDVRRHLKNFNPRKSNRVNTFSLLALEDALGGARIKVKRDDHDTALVMGVSQGPQSTISRFTGSLYPDPKRVRTLEFAAALMNSAASSCSIVKGMKGWNTTLATGVNASLGALCYGSELIRQESQPRALVGGADELYYGVLQWLQLLFREISRSAEPTGFQTYSSGHGGYFLGEGAVMVLVEDMETAKERDAPILAEIAGYGRSNDASAGGEQIDAEGSGLAHAAMVALSASGLRADQIDLICGTSWGTPPIDKKETGAIRAVFGPVAARIPVVNYNAHFGFLEASAGLLNLAMVLEAMRRCEIPPVPYTKEFCANDIFFLRERLKRQVNYAMLLGSSEQGNNYAVILKRGAADA